MIYLKLFLCFLQIGLLSIGGGYAVLPLIQAQVVDKYAWLTMDSFTDLITISEMTPGPIAINSATFVGMQIGGILGAIVATLGFICIPLIIVLTMAYFYQKYSKSALMEGILQGLRPVIAALIFQAALTISCFALFNERKIMDINLDSDNINYLSILLFTLSFLTLRRFKVKPIWVILSSGFLSLIFLNLF